MTKTTTKSLDLKRRLREATTDEERQSILDGLPHEVGFAKPPKSRRFQPGKSGNPKGRLKGSSNLATLLVEELEQTIEVNENGRRRKLPKGRIAVRQLINLSAQGDIKAFSLTTDLLRKTGQLDKAPEPREDIFTPRDLESAENLLNFYKPSEDSAEGSAP